LTGANPTPIRSFAAANSDAAFGVRVAVGDLDGDGFAEIVTGSRNSVTIQQSQFGNVRTDANRRGAVGRFTSAPVLVRGIPVAADTAGVFVAVGDFTGSGKADIAAGYVANGTARVRVVSGQNTGRMLMTSFGFTAVPLGGVPVAFRDIAGTGKQSLIAAGGQGTSQVRILNATAGGIARSFMSMTPSYTGGVFVG
jgi:serralysin